MTKDNAMAPEEPRVGNGGITMRVCSNCGLAVTRVVIDMARIPNCPRCGEVRLRDFEEQRIERENRHAG